MTWYNYQTEQSRGEREMGQGTPSRPARPAQAGITVNYEAVDGYTERRKFYNLAGAQAYAQKWVGENYELGGWYAISADGVGRVTVDGVRLEVLFPPKPQPKRRPAPAGMYYDEETDRYEFQPNEGGYIAMQGDPWAGYDEDYGEEDAALRDVPTAPIDPSF